MQYTRNELDLDTGERIGVRGDVIDIFPRNPSARPCVSSFSTDTIDLDKSVPIR